MVNPNIINRLIPIIKCERKCALCAFYNPDGINFTSGRCYYNENGCPIAEDAHPTSATNSCSNFAHMGLKSLMDISLKLEAGKDIQLFGLRELSDSHKLAITQRAREAVADGKRVRLTEFSVMITNELHFPRDLISEHMTRLAADGVIAIYEQPGVSSIPARMMCAVGNIPSEKELVKECVRLREEARIKRNASLKARRMLMPKVTIQTPKVKSKKTSKRSKTSRHVSAKS